MFDFCLVVNLTNISHFDYSVGKNRQRNPHCIRSTETECDLTNEFKGDLKGVYTAEVLSEPLPGMTTDHVELPFTRSKPFCPYNDSECCVFSSKTNCFPY